MTIYINMNDGDSDAMDNRRWPRSGYVGYPTTRLSDNARRGRGIRILVEEFNS